MVSVVIVGADLTADVIRQNEAALYRCGTSDGTALKAYDEKSLL